MELNKLKEALKESWNKETCYPKIRDQWNPKNPAFGQCAVTALVVQDFFGGDILFCSHQNHFWNRLPNGREIDFTHEQFPEGTKICADKSAYRRSILGGYTAKRYTILISKMLDLL